MAIFTFKGNQIGEALQFDGQGLTTTVEIGRVWFGPTDTVRITTAPGTTDASGAFVGGAGAITGFTVTTATGAVTNFFASPDGLDVDPDQAKQGPDFFYLSETPGPGIGGAYAGLVIEKVVVTDVALTMGAQVAFGNLGGFNPGTGPVAPQPTLIGTAGNDFLFGTELGDYMEGRQGNDTIRSRGGDDTVLGGAGNDRIDGGDGNDRLRGGDGDDRLVGGRGNDRLVGDAGNDILDGGNGRDVLTGGSGGDTFVFSNGDRVTDFNAAEGDQIAFKAALGLSLADISITQTAIGTTVSWAGSTMFLQGVSQPFDFGNAFDFGYQPSFDFV